jgi:hypothetical protein
VSGSTPPRHRRTAPVPSEYGAPGKRPLLRRGKRMAVELRLPCRFSRPRQNCAGAISVPCWCALPCSRRYPATQMIRARKRPDMSFKLRRKRVWSKSAAQNSPRHFQFVAVQRSDSRQSWFLAPLPAPQIARRRSPSTT